MREAFLSPLFNLSSRDARVTRRRQGIASRRLPDDRLCRNTRNCIGILSDFRGKVCDARFVLRNKVSSKLGTRKKVCGTTFEDYHFREKDRPSALSTIVIFGGGNSVFVIGHYV